MYEHKSKDEELAEAITKLGASLDIRLRKIEQKVDPMYNIFLNVNGFNQISIWVFKILIGIGAAIGALYAVIEFLKRVSK